MEEIIRYTKVSVEELSLDEEDEVRDDQVNLD